MILKKSGCCLLVLCSILVCRKLLANDLTPFHVLHSVPTFYEFWFYLLGNSDINDCLFCIIQSWPSLHFPTSSEVFNFFFVYVNSWALFPRLCFSEYLSHKLKVNVWRNIVAWSSNNPQLSPGTVHTDILWNYDMNSGKENNPRIYSYQMLRPRKLVQENR